MRMVTAALVLVASLAVGHVAGAQCQPPTGADRNCLTWQDNSTNEFGFDINRKLLTFSANTTINSAVIVWTSGTPIAQLVAGTVVLGANIPAGATIAGTAGNNVTLTLAATATGTAQTMQAGVPTANANAACNADPAALAKLTTVGPNVTAYIDLAVVEGPTYCYGVDAFNSGGASGLSNIAGRTVPFVAPISPGNTLTVAP